MGAIDWSVGLFLCLNKDTEKVVNNCSVKKER